MKMLSTKWKYTEKIWSMHLSGFIKFNSLNNIILFKAHLIMQNNSYCDTARQFESSLSFVKYVENLKDATKVKLLLCW